MNTKDERNEHFQGFAKLLWQRLQAEIEYGPHHGNLAMQKPALETLIAQRAYDLVSHTIDSLNDDYFFEPYTYASSKEEITEDENDLLSHIPDLTEWPTPPKP